jgi:SAM-dependent methyltransferase
VPSAKPARFWLRFPHEATRCPACSSTHIALLDAFRIHPDSDDRCVAFLTGCHACGLLFANPLPTAPQLQQYYSADGPCASVGAERVLKIEEAHRRLGGKKSRPKIRKAAGGPDLLLDALARYAPVHEPPPGAKVLDFGCGDGKFLNRLQDLGWETYGIEPSSHVAFLRHRRLDAPPSDASFDLVVLHHVLEHVTPPLDVLRQLAGALRDGGLLFLSVPRLDTLPQHGDLTYCLNGMSHVVSFSERCLAGLLSRAGFAIAARLSTPELDDSLTKGKPLRLRLVARRTATPPPSPEAPLAPALEALRQHARVNVSAAGRVRGMCPVRLSAALLARGRARPARRVQRALLTVLGSPRWLYKRVKHGFLLGVREALVVVRRLGITPLVERLCERFTGRRRLWRGGA